jgi:hypothetical protein
MITGDTASQSAQGPSRLTHEYDGELVVFLIGIRIRRWRRPDLWGPVFAAMPPMLRELSRDAGSGMLGYRLIMDPRGPWTVQYWSSLDKLYAYASAPRAAHRPAWAAFNRRARRVPDAVGVWHETYPVSRAESIYVGMPPVGLAEFTGSRPVTSRGDRARDRQAGRDL